MSGQIAAHGRLGRDPRPIETSSGKPMATAAVAVTVESRGGGETGEATLWLDVIGFGRVADDLARHRQGDPVSMSGRLQLSTYRHREAGEERESWQVVANAVVSSRTVRPSGGKRKAGGGAGEARSEGRQRTVWPASGPGGPTAPDPPPRSDADVPFDDPLPF